MMRVRLKLFAISAQLAGADLIELDLDEGARVADLRRALAEHAPGLRPLIPQFMFAINSQYATDETEIPASAEIACIPPVSGG
jgi:molybdopterin synthase catalytic subunit/molybdopterin synthase sulfur carrier subunit